MHTFPLFQYSKCVSKSMDDFIPAMVDVFDGLIIEPSASKNPGGEACLCHEDLAEVSLSSIYYGQQAKAAFEMPGNLHIISLITQGRASYAWGKGEHESAADINFLPANSFLNMSFTPDCCQVLVALHGSAQIGEVYNDLYRFAGRDKLLKTQIKYLMLDLVRHTHFTKSYSYSQHLLREFNQKLIDTLLGRNEEVGLVFSNQPPGKVKSSCVQETIEFMHFDSDWEYDVEVLASKCFTSVRSYYNHFKAETGLTPYQYHTNLRLLLVRLDILRAESLNKTIAQMAVDRGFYHLSRFSAQYRKLFGEFPRETLLNARKSN